MSDSDWTYMMLYGAIFLSLFAIAELMFHRWKVDAEVTRKFVHIGAGLTCFSFPFFLGSHWAILILSCAFIGILLLSMRFGWLKSLNDVGRKTGGTYIFPIVIYINFWAYSVFGLKDMDANHLLQCQFESIRTIYSSATIYYFLPVLILTISDPIAALFGTRWPFGMYQVFGHKKTIVGSSAFFLSAMMLSIVPLSILSESIGMGIFIAAITALSATIVEALSHRGLDNLFIPLTVLIVLILFRDFIQL